MMPAAPRLARLSVVDPIVEEAIREKQIPGAVVIVGHEGRVIYRKAFGSRAIEPRREPMTLDTIFDLASLTKVLATTTAVMQLVEQGKVKPNDAVAKYLPEFAQNGKDDITVRQLLVHYSGLPPDLDLTKSWEGKETAYRMAFELKPETPPGSGFVYSDINFIVLGALVERVSGQALDVYVAEHVFAPLKMTETRYLPPAAWKGKIAPTEEDENKKMLRGVVHDPTARRMGGVAGNAGVFGTADDLAKFAQALLDGGGGILAPLTVEKMTSPQQPPIGDRRARIWVGHRHAVFLEPRRPVAGRIVRPHRLHGHFDVDRSDDPDLHHHFHQCDSCGGQGKCGGLAHESRDGGGGGPALDRR